MATECVTCKQSLVLKLMGRESEDACDEPEGHAGDHRSDTGTYWRVIA